MGLGDRGRWDKETGGEVGLGDREGEQGDECGQGKEGTVGSYCKGEQGEL